MLNCKPGDLAMVIAVWPVSARNLTTGEMIPLLRYGTIVQITEPDPKSDVSLPRWILKEPIPFDISFADGQRLKGEVLSLPDEILKPLPGLEDEKGVFAQDNLEERSQCLAQLAKSLDRRSENV